MQRAKSYLDEKRIKEIIFSRSTYHVQILDLATNDPAWPFIQLDEQNHVQDCFCSCQVELAPACEHIAAALLKIFDDYGRPLHARFKHSFWKQISHLFAMHYGYDRSILIKNGTSYELKHQKETIFSIQGLDELTTKTIKSYVERQLKETEETSLKFSNLPKKELELWQQGRPSEAFRFELSFWSDLAKWLFLLQEDHASYQVQFQISKGLPAKIKIHFAHVQIMFALSKEILEAIIPYLNTIDSPLKVYESHDHEVEEIIYEAEEKSLIIIPKSNTTSTPEKKEDGIVIGAWRFVLNHGFYPCQSPTLENKNEKILSHQIDGQLEKNHPFFKKYLKKISLEQKPITPKYTLSFDKKWNLNIQMFLFEPNDLLHPLSVFFGHWVYLHPQGFFRLKEDVFHQASLFIPKDKVSEFIHHYRSWLNSQKGFEVHLASLQAKMSYSVNNHKQLIFHSHLDTDHNESYDFGDWIYVKHQGFYTKMRFFSLIKNGLVISKHEVAKFIQSHKEELETIPHFFNSKCPVSKASLELHAQGQNIVVKPKYHFYDGYELTNAIFFEDYCYFEGLGFYQLSKNLLLPEGFRKETKITPYEQIAFMSLHFQNLKPFISYVDPKLNPATDLKLSLKSFDEHQYELIYKNKKGLDLDVTELYNASKQGVPYFFSNLGLINLKHPRFSWILDLKKEQIHQTHLKLTPIEMIRLEAIDTAFDPTASFNLIDQIYPEIQNQKYSLKGFKPKLRPYQTVGLDWLWRLYCCHLSGILCDDMGLGKTLQSMALMAAIKNQSHKKLEPGQKAPKKKFLIVCPTSVIYHWQDKLTEFYPHLKILTFYGLHRSLKRFQQKFDILLTSYGILRIDQKPISKIDFTLAIFDELQIAKNHRSLTYTALTQVQAKMKLGLTGTPIENNIRELKALIDLVIPSYMPADDQFRDQFINPIEKDHQEDRKKILKKMIEPFILRRKKEDVLKDLPDKTEQISHCELTTEQAKLYSFYLNQSKDTLLKELKDDQKPISYIHIFALLTKLKQICNHPKSLDKEKYKDLSSGKWELFVELLQEARDSGQKVVVFSQYLNMLGLIEEHLIQNNIGYATITGSTKDRKTPLETFKTDPKCEVFVGSLKAVGLGVDLTAASVVIHYDRWWNAAREDQATDRVHRIGQQKGVQVFKMVTLNTLEEKINHIISRKGKLLEDIIGTSDQEEIKAFSREDLIEILQFSQKEIYENA